MIDAVSTGEEILPAVFKEVGMFECGKGTDIFFKIFHPAGDHGVDDGYGITAGEEEVNEMRTDKSGTTGNNTMHTDMLALGND